MIESIPGTGEASDIIARIMQDMDEVIRLIERPSCETHDPSPEAAANAKCDAPALAAAA